VRTVPIYAVWHDEFSPLMYATKMCDCNLYGVRERGYKDAEGQWIPTPHPAHEVVAYPVSQTCKHEMPPTLYTALRAHLPGGRVVELNP
jgi:hypothetical protein